MKLENMMKMKKYNKEKPAINANVLSEIKRKVNNIKQFWILFTKNKIWIFSALFVASIIHSIINYGMYGINILEFVTITDIFINFAIVFIPIVALLPLSVFLYLFPNGNTKIEAIILLIVKSILLISSSFILSRLFNSLLGGGLWLLFILGFLWLFYCENKKAFTWMCILTLFMVSFVTPFDTHTTSLINRFSFKCSNKEYNLTDIEKFYYIGGSSDYFFIFDKQEDRVEILPKSECKEISRTSIHMDDLWKCDDLRSNGLILRVKKR